MDKHNSKKLSFRGLKCRFVSMISKSACFLVFVFLVAGYLFPFWKRDQPKQCLLLTVSTINKTLAIGVRSRNFLVTPSSAHVSPL